MIWFAIIIAWLSGTLVVSALVLWQQAIHDWRPAAIAAALGTAIAFLVGYFAR